MTRIEARRTDASPSIRCSPATLDASYRNIARLELREQPTRDTQDRQLL